MNYVVIYDLYSYIIVFDGCLMLEVLVYCVVEMCVGILVIIDYDIIVVIVLVREEILCLGLVLNFIFGVEIFMVWENYEIYIVGLNIDIIYLLMCEFFVQQIEWCNQRVQLIAERFEKV